jgi:hypothetical protein
MGGCGNTYPCPLATITGTCTCTYADSCSYSGCHPYTNSHSKVYAVGECYYCRSFGIGSSESGQIAGFDGGSGWDSAGIGRSEWLN